MQTLNLGCPKKVKFDDAESVSCFGVWGLRCKKKLKPQTVSVSPKLYSKLKPQTETPNPKLKPQTVWGLRFGVWSLGFGVLVVGCGAWGLGFGVQSPGCCVQGLVCPRIHPGLEFRV